MSNELRQKNEFSLLPTNYQEALNYAQVIARSSFCPTSFKGKPEDVLLAVQMGRELNLPPLQALQNVAVINGKPSIYGDAALAVCQNHPAWAGHLEMEYSQIKAIQKNVQEGTVKLNELDEFTQAIVMQISPDCEHGYVCAVKRGKEPVTVKKFSQKDAQDAKLWGKPGPWQQYATRMLQMRARGFALRDKFSDALRGLITKEEAQDYPAEAKPISSGVNVIYDNQTVIENSLDETEDPTLTIGKSDALEKLLNIINEKNIPNADIERACERAECEELAQMPVDKLVALASAWEKRQ